MTDTRSELKEILKHYDIGELIGWERDDRGYVNVSYAIETVVDGEKHSYFLRRYKKGIKKRELEFEHSIINHLTEKRFGPVASVLKTKNGKTYVQRSAGRAGEEAIFYAIFDFLSGEDRYTWINPTCGEREVESAAAVLARFHDAMFGFSPQGSRVEPKIINLLPVIADNVKRCAKRTKDTPFDAYLTEHREQILQNIQRTRRTLAGEESQELVQVVIHCDYHPGNLKFHGEEATGLFDFDWSKVDARCFDVALAILYFFVAWEDEKDGALDLEQLLCFLNAYQDTLKNTRGIGPLSHIELRCLPTMINASNLYVLNWTLLDCYDKEVDADEYLMYLRHGVRTMQWLEHEKNRESLQKTCASAEVHRES